MRDDLPLDSGRGGPGGVQLLEGGTRLAGLRDGGDVVFAALGTREAAHQGVVQRALGGIQRRRIGVDGGLHRRLALAQIGGHGLVGRGVERRDVQVR